MSIKHLPNPDNLPAGPAPSDPRLPSAYPPPPNYYYYGAPGSNAAGPYSEEPDQPSVPLSHYLWILRRHRYKILAFVAASVAATYIVSARLTPIYESTAVVDIDRQAPTGLVGQEAQSLRAINDSDQFIATQINLIQSDAVLRPVTERYDLRKHEKQKVDPRVRPEAAAEAPIVLKNLKVTRPPNTYILKIAYRSPDPQLAANVANGIARSYIEHTYNIRIRASASMSTFMQNQIEEIKAKMERSSEALIRFEKELNVINPEEKTSILSARLMQLNQEYTAAQADRVRKESAYNSSRDGSLEAAQVSTQGEELKKLRERLNEAEEDLARIKQQYGAQHPEHRKAAARVNTLNKQNDNALQNILRRIETEYHESQSREAMLQKSVAETKKEFDTLNARSYDYQRLKREAETDKKLYDELLRRVNEAGINAGFQNNSIRFADQARPAVKPVFPSIPLNLGLAFLLSSILALGTAILADTLDNTLRSPDQLSQIFNGPTVGLLPLIVKGRPNALSSAATALANAKEDGSSEEGALVPLSEAEKGLTMYEESIRTLHSSILLADLDQRTRSLLVTSTGPSEGKSTTASHLAISNASLGKRTLIVDGDLRRPSLHRVFGLSAAQGFSNVLLGELEWRDAVTPVPGYKNLDIMVAGPPSRRAPDLVAGGLIQFLEQATREYDLVVLDSPPLMNFAEPLHMATAVDGVVLITVAGETHKKAVQSAVSTLRRVRANVACIVLNKVTRDLSSDYNAYGYYGKYYKRYYHANA
ncbi:MAG: polysaccharide biosynthesis tyrosine autokinase [Bryobacterales bacterium]|nr:polysaccharide biosynthesis tyrosine autokinase [Bryobacterales bacterium]